MQTKSSKKSIKLLIAAVAALILSGAAEVDAYAQSYMIQQHQPARNTVYASKLKQQLGFLSDPICEGRGTGTRGGSEAAFWLIREFEKVGLMKIGESYGKKFYTNQGTLGRNIVGMIPGSKHVPRDKYVIVGAHYDHIGKLDGKFYPGADANASGTIALLNIAKMVATTKMFGKTYDYNIIFVAFDGKEVDMAGSKGLWKMIENGELTDPLRGKAITKDKVKLMVNIDQIGSTLSPLKSGRKDFIIMLGNNSLKPSQRDLLHYCNKAYAIDMEIDLTYYGSKNFTQMFYRLSDQRVFVDNGIPAVFFTSGITLNTNKTRDTAETLDYDILRKRIYLIYHWLDKML